MPVEHAFPEPLVYEPASGTHKHTVILLHGRGGSADAFGPAILNTALPLADTRTRRGWRTDPPARDGMPAEPADHNRPTTLAQVLPHARFVFPTAPKQRATVYRRSIIRQWFDDWHLGFTADEVDGRYDLGLQTDGLGRTVAYLHGLVAEEGELVGGAHNVILGGISQGCAASLVASLLWEGEEGLGGVVGMCGWLPYISQIKEQLRLGVGGNERSSGKDKDSEEEAGFDPFDRSASPGCDATSPGNIDTGWCVAAALDWLRCELDMPRRQSAASHVLRSSSPAMLCHGRDDGKVEVAKGSEAAEFLSALGMGHCCFKEFAGVGHEFSAGMLFGIAKFIQDVLGGSSS
ncbi:hypothetical protein INS49_015670 [Diaporthe citri]|uniref:uncharacterized protein n=1 Tax=Diaporthe citri TaxID=83186 RepID=UPI001C81BF1F|nr:uncharacterized protein INS49_015670 [Diaporthe citri]KAG6356283.1 hypothetical protein INS49_015670 [Diaporthe citri]